jgi:hypothetical protein
MTKWAEDTARALMRDHLEVIRGDDATEESLAQACRELEHRLACGLLQARAQEARQINGESTRIAMGAELQEIRIVALELAGQCLDRSHALERIGIEIANGPWPIPRVEVVQ